MARPRFFFNDTATTEIYTLSLHDALPICAGARPHPRPRDLAGRRGAVLGPRATRRSEEHTSELQSQSNIVCRLLLEKKNDRALQALADHKHCGNKSAAIRDVLYKEAGMKA